MIKLVPNWAENYDDFWAAIRRRNLLFIKLRYIAIAMLIVLSIIPQFIFNIELSDLQIRVMSFVILFMFFYNILLQYIRPKLTAQRGQFNPLHLSLLQIILDLFSLTILVYFLGGIEQPLYLFYIFHMVIGSLILPGFVIYGVAVVTVLVVLSIFCLTYLGVIPHYQIEGFLISNVHNDFAYVLSISTEFTIMMLLSVFLANRIAHQLYTRERQLFITLDKLNKLEDKKQRYIMGVVHEIKTPITAVKTTLDLMLNGILGEVPEHLLGKLKRIDFRTNESLEIINSIIRISDIRSSKENKHTTFFVADLIDELIENSRDRFELKKIDLSFDKSQWRRQAIEGDANMIKLVFSNLIGNALKYSPEKSKIQLSIISRINYQEIVICDNGVGIPEKDIERIFERNYRASNIVDTNIDGSGLGLSFVKEIIEQHFGEIFVKSPSSIGNDEHPGTCFYVKLPYDTDHSIMHSASRKKVRGGV